MIEGGVDCWKERGIVPHARVVVEHFFLEHAYHMLRALMNTPNLNKFYQLRY
jgi:hypothetical protein